MTSHANYMYLKTKEIASYINVYLPFESLHYLKNCLEHCVLDVVVTNWIKESVIYSDYLIHWMPITLIKLESCHHAILSPASGDEKQNIKSEKARK